MYSHLPWVLLELWQIFAGVSLLFFLVSLIFILINKKLGNQEKTLWLLGTVLLPIMGPILFLTLGRFGK